MNNNNAVNSYIKNQLKDFNSDFINCVCRCFNLLEQMKEPNGCLSNTAALFVCAKEYGYNPEICFGLCEFDGKQFYHAWLSINETIIDIAIYGNVNYSPYSMWKFKLKTPYIGSYDEANMHYGKFEFDNDWNKSDISQVEGWSLEKYMNESPQSVMWIICCMFLGKEPTPSYIKHLKEHVKGIKLVRK